MRKSTLVRLAVTLPVLAIGVSAVVFGGADDSPGLQGIGVILGVTALWWQFRRR